MAQPQKKIELQQDSEEKKPAHAGMEDYAKMQKHQKDLMDWLMQMDSKEATQFLDQVR